MPGIAGVVGPVSPDEGKRLVRTMIGSMQHRRTYAAGVQFDAGIGVHAGWVAHPGSVAAAQSGVAGADGTRLLLSGECLLPQDGPAAGADGGSLLEGYAGGAERFVCGLNGLFSGMLIDPPRKRAWLFNDRYGCERIYVCENGDTLLFASEAKALLSVLPEARAFDDEGVAQFLTWGSTFDGRSLFRGIRVLPGGTLWAFGPGEKRREGRYFRPEEWESQPPLDESAFRRRFEDTFRTVLPAYVSSGHEAVGISITGGLDTRMIMACLPETQPPPLCYTYVGLSGRTLDARLGARVAGVCGLKHHDLRIGSDFLADFGAHVDRTVFVTDGCAGALQAHELYYSRLARALSSVRLTGNYGSEIFRGVSTFKPLGLAGDLFAPVRGRAENGMSPADPVHPVTRATFREIPWHLFGVLAAARTELTVRSPFLDNRIVALAYQTPAHARQTPNVALGLIRSASPALAAIPSDRGLCGRAGPVSLGRRLFCEATFRLDYLYSYGLPHRASRLDRVIGRLSRIGLLGLHKFLPYRAWFRRELAPYLADVLGESCTRQMPYWNGRMLPSIVADHVSGRRNYTNELHAIVTLEAVQRTLIRGFGHDELVGREIIACES
jgi:asparagine synthase (glutamine-hydrolysing)